MEQFSEMDYGQHKQSRRKPSALNSKQLHAWNYKVSAWVPVDKTLKMLSTKKSKIKSTTGVSKKYGGLDQYEVQMYQIIEKICETVYELSIPSELLMMILIYSQGYKFEIGDKVWTFPCGIFEVAAKCIVKGVIEDEKDGKQCYKVRRTDAAGIFRVPLHHVFAPKLLVINAKKYNKDGREYHVQLQDGQVLKIQGMEVATKQVYSKKKDRMISKSVVIMYVGNYDEVEYDTSVFVQAKTMQYV